MQLLGILQECNVQMCGFLVVEGAELCNYALWFAAWAELCLHGQEIKQSEKRNTVLHIPLMAGMCVCVDVWMCVCVYVCVCVCVCARGNARAKPGQATAGPRNAKG